MLNIMRFQITQWEIILHRKGVFRIEMPFCCAPKSRLWENIFLKYSFFIKYDRIY